MATLKAVADKQKKMYIKMYLIGLPLKRHVLFYLRVNICSPRASSNLTSFGFHNQGPPNFGEGGGGERT